MQHFFTSEKWLGWPMGKIITVESTFHALPDEDIKTIILSKLTGSLKQEKELMHRFKMLGIADILEHLDASSPE